jgi:hypothetical protein
MDYAYSKIKASEKQGRKKRRNRGSKNEEKGKKTENDKERIIVVKWLEKVL